MQTIASVFFMRYLPDEIPMHFDSAGKTDRFGSKYELFILLVFSLIAIVVWLGIRKDSIEKIKKEPDERKRTALVTNAYVFGLCQICFVLVMAGVELSLYVTGIKNSESIPDVGGGDLAIMIVNILIAIMFIIIGNVMPKSRINGTFGVRTVWSSYNNEVWARSNLFGGIASIITGIAIIPITIFVSVTTAMIFIFILVCVMALADIIASFVFYKQAKAAEK